jgi:hemoglobin-like flavoprotein
LPNQQTDSAWSFDPAKRELVRTSFAKIVLVPDVGAMFYDRLFSIDPSLRSLFKDNIVETGRLLMTVVSVAIDNLDQIERIIPAIRNLGRRHRGYGVKRADYEAGKDAFLWAIEQALGEDFTPPVRDAWLTWYQLLAAEMQTSNPPPG